MPAPLEPELRAKIRKLAKAGYTATAIGKQLGVGRHTVARYAAADVGRTAAAQQGETAVAPRQDGGITTLPFGPAEIEHLHWIARFVVRVKCLSCAKPVLFFRGTAVQGRCVACGAVWRHDPCSAAA